MRELSMIEYFNYLNIFPMSLLWTSMSLHTFHYTEIALTLLTAKLANY